PALGILDDDLADFAELAGAHEFTRLLDHDVAGVVVGEGEDASGLGDDFLQGAGFLEVESDGFVADDVEAFFEEELGGRKVLVVGRDDDDEVEAIGGGAGGLGGGHLGVGTVNAGRVEEEVGAGGPGTFGVGGKGAGDEFGLAVHLNGDAVDGTDEGAAPAADHAVAEFAGGGHGGGNGGLPTEHTEYTKESDSEFRVFCVFRGQKGFGLLVL